MADDRGARVLAARAASGEGSPRADHGSSPTLAEAASVLGRVLVIAAAGFVLLILLAKLRVVVFPVVAAVLLSTVLTPPAAWLRRRGWPSFAATWAALLTLALALGLAIWVIVPPAVDELGGLGPSLEEAGDDIERWAVDGPLGLDEDQIDRFRSGVGDQMSGLAEGDGLVSGAMAAAEVVTGIVLTVVLTFFFVKDGPVIQQWAIEHVRADRRRLAREAAAKSWSALGGYVRGAALLGVVEAAAIGLTLLLVGADLVLAVALLTFLGAFLPVVGAVVAGIVAVGVAFASGGLGDAVVVAVVALVVQQLDADLLAPVIYGRMTPLHPVVVVLSVTAGGALGGIGGAFLAVPVTVVAVAVGGVLWRHRAGGGPAQLQTEARGVGLDRPA